MIIIIVSLVIVLCGLVVVICQRNNRYSTKCFSAGSNKQGILVNNTAAEKNYPAKAGRTNIPRLAKMVPDRDIFGMDGSLSEILNLNCTSSVSIYV